MPIKTLPTKVTMVFTIDAPYDTRDDWGQAGALGDIREQVETAIKALHAHGAHRVEGTFKIMPQARSLRWRTLEGGWDDARGLNIWSND